MPFCRLGPAGAADHPVRRRPHFTLRPAIRQAERPANLEITGGGINDTAKASTDAKGNWSMRYRVPGAVSIPATMSVRASYGEQPSDIVSILTFRVPTASLSVAPDPVVPGAALTLNAAGFPRYESDIAVKIGDFDVAVPTGAAADGEGKVKNLTVTVPALDAGAYTIRLQVGGAVAISTVTVLDEIPHVDADLEDALAPLGDNLVRVFYFDNTSQTWSFYDPRPEFAELNTLTTLSPGQSYWILVGDSASANLNATARNLTCLAGECWNSIVW